MTSAEARYCGPMRSSWVTALLLTFLAVGTASCLKWEPRNTEGVRIVNGTDETVTVVVRYPEPAEEMELVTYRPGESSVENRMVGQSGCTRADMVAITDEGLVIDRQDAPICVDDEWIIGD